MVRWAGARVPRSQERKSGRAIDAIAWAIDARSLITVGYRLAHSWPDI